MICRTVEMTRYSAIFLLMLHKIENKMRFTVDEESTKEETIFSHILMKI